MQNYIELLACVFAVVATTDAKLLTYFFAILNLNLQHHNR